MALLAIAFASGLGGRCAWLPALLGLAGCAGGGAPPMLSDPAAPAMPARAAAAGGVGTPCHAGPRERPIVVGSGVADDPAQPEPASGYRLGLRPLHAQRFAVVAAHPLATRTGCAVLAAGGSAADAAVAVQAVLGLVEPQSSGLGGGAFALHFDAASGAVTSYDGRETAPTAALPDDLRWIAAADRRAPRPDARASGRSIGVPGALRLLEALHADHGRRAWSGLFDDAIRLADEGFPIGGRLADAIAAAREPLRRDADAAATLLHPDGSPRGLGERLRNPAYADTLRRVAAGGAQAFYEGPIAQAIVAEVARTRADPVAATAGDDAGATAAAAAVGAPPARTGSQAPASEALQPPQRPSQSFQPRQRPPASDAFEFTPGRMTLADLAGYRAVRRDPLCHPYRAWIVCGMGPPSSGGLAVAQALGVLEAFDLRALAPRALDGQGKGDGGVPDPRAMHLMAEALRLAFADRDRWVADTDFVPLPGRGAATLLDPAYLARRAALIRPDRSLGRAPAGRFDGAAAGGASGHEGQGTSHVSIVDAAGNAVSMTTTVESSLGAWRMVHGVVLNNQLTDFSPVPVDADGPIANRLQGGKRPRSSMAPTLVFERRADGRRGALHLVAGSVGGPTIIAHVLKSLVGVLDWGLDAQQAAGFVNLAAFNTPLTLIGAEHPQVDARDDGAADRLAAALRARGHEVRLLAQPSGLALIVRDLRDMRDLRHARGARGGWQAGVDPRREGLALGH
jgi:gamma-glutamyltranspeptidase / glutathione hydrolase